MGVACTKTLSRVNMCMRHHVMENGGEGGVERGEGTAEEGRMGREDVGRRRRVGVVWWCGVVWCGVVCFGVVWCGVVWCGHMWVTRGTVRPPSGFAV